MTPGALDHEQCYRALCARDRRFDGVFFVGVETTGIYCRPICPARTPGKARCRFFAHAAEAERAGFRACFRCRPERAPGLATADATPRLVASALAKIGAGALDRGSVDDVAASLGITSRHLRRAVEAAVGVSPIELAQTRRLGLAKLLLHDTALPLTDVAFASGFASVRRFNAAFQERFGQPPSALRRSPASRRDGITLRLDARAPFAAPALFEFLRGRAIPGVEEVTATTYRRFASFAGASGWLEAAIDPERAGIVVRLDASLVPAIGDVVARLRALFDLDARPDVIDAALATDRALAPLVARTPGLRVPGAFDPWELLVRAILGQQVSVAAATTISGRLVAAFGAEPRFPSAAVLAAASIDDVRAIGLPRARAETVIGVARAVASGAVDLAPGADPDRVTAALLEVRGIGPWTAAYVSMRVRRRPDAFLSGDLAAKKALGVTRASDAERLSARWRPFRAYALMHLWRSLSGGG